MRIRITRAVETTAVYDEDDYQPITFTEGSVVEAKHITKIGNAVVDLDNGVAVLPVGSWEMYQKPEHYTTIVLRNGENHVECTCDWSLPENLSHPEPILALRKSGMTHVRYTEAVR